VGVSVLEAYAAAVPAAERGPTTRIVALRNGYRNDAFLQEFDGTTEPLGPPRVVPAATLDDEIPPEAVLIGDGASRYAGDIRPLGRRTLPEPEALAEHVGAVAAKRASLSRSGDACPLRPLYVRPVDIGVARR
jgi:hypothetical protein